MLLTLDESLAANKLATPAITKEVNVVEGE